jgi:hypothetical protein
VAAKRAISRAAKRCMADLAVRTSIAFDRTAK